MSQMFAWIISDLIRRCNRNRGNGFVDKVVAAWVMSSKQEDFEAVELVAFELFTFAFAFKSFPVMVHLSSRCAQQTSV